jgi:hypothetical protein
MAYNTIADNHLSGLAKKGRHGDTEISLSKHVTPGKLWHVNPFEKSLMERGVGGERIVDAIGSGTFNPETGLEEKGIVGDVIAGMEFMVSTGTAIQGAGIARDEANIQLGLLDKQQDALKLSQDSLFKAKEDKQAAIQSQFQFDLEGMAAETGQSKEDLLEGYNENIRKSGLYTSGGADQKKSTMWNRIRSSFERGKEGLFGQLGEKMGAVEGWFEGETGRIQADLDKIEGERKVQKIASKKKFLGMV